MFDAIALLFFCQLLGEIIHRLTGVPLPGSVIGMVLLIGWLAISRREYPTLTAVSGWLTAHLSIMFVPAAVGLIDEGPVLSKYGIGLLIAAVTSTVLTMLVSVYVFQWAVHRFGDGSDESATEEQA